MNVASNRDPEPTTTWAGNFDIHDAYEALLATGRVKLLRAALPRQAGPGKSRGNRAQRRAMERGR